MGSVEKAMIGQHTKESSAKLTKTQVNHDMWLRVKEHQERLKKVLVREAKKDIYERLVAEQAELDKYNQ